MYVWIAACTGYDGTMYIGVYSSRDKGKAACAEHADHRELSWQDLPDFSTAGPYDVEEAEVK